MQRNVNYYFLHKKVPPLKCDRDVFKIHNYFGWLNI